MKKNNQDREKSMQDKLRECVGPVYSTDYGRNDFLLHISLKKRIEGVRAKKNDKGLEGILGNKFINKAEYEKSRDIGYVQQAEAIHRARLQGYSQKEIAEYYGVKTSVVRGAEKEFFDLNEITRAKQEKRIKEAGAVHKLTEMNLTQKEISEILKISRSTVRRRKKLYYEITEKQHEEKEPGHIENIVCYEEPAIEKQHIRKETNAGPVNLQMANIPPIINQLVYFGESFESVDSDKFAIRDFPKKSTDEDSLLSILWEILKDGRKGALYKYEQAQVDYDRIAAGILNRLKKGIDASEITEHYTKKYKGKYRNISEDIKNICAFQKKISHIEDFIERKRLEKDFIFYGDLETFLDGVPGHNERQLHKEEIVESQTIGDEPGFLTEHNPGFQETYRRFRRFCKNARHAIGKKVSNAFYFLIPDDDMMRRSWRRVVATVAVTASAGALLAGTTFPSLMRYNNIPKPEKQKPSSILATKDVEKFSDEDEAQETMGDIDEEELLRFRRMILARVEARRRKEFEKIKEFVVCAPQIAMDLGNSLLKYGMKLS